MIGVTSLPTRSAMMSTRGNSAIARGVGESVKNTIKPRVNELRRNQLSAGTTDIGKIMSFSGPAPELINGRLAMLGFTAAMGAELTSQETFVQQFSDAPGTILAVSALLVVASLIPIVRGSAVMDDGGGEGVRPGGFNVTNELINGRAAMLGLSILIGYEALTGAALF